MSNRKFKRLDEKPYKEMTVYELAEAYRKAFWGASEGWGNWERHCQAQYKKIAEELKRRG